METSNTTEKEEIREKGVQLAKELKTHLRKMGITEVLLANLVGVSIPTIYLWGKGVLNPSYRNSLRLINTLDMLEKGEGKCPHGHALGSGVVQHTECRDCAHRLDCMRYARYKSTLSKT